MEATVEIRSGSLAGRTFRLQPGQSVRVGRTALADFVVSDRSMSAVHFIVECDEKGCFLHDPGSSNGTLVNGREVRSARLGQGDMISAGETLFAVHVIDERPKPQSMPAVLQPVPSTPKEKLITMLRGEFQPLYALLDAACEPSVLKVLFESKEQYQSLFEGQQGAQLAHFAPYLVRLPAESPFIASLVEQGWGKNWGIFVTCQETLEDLRRHFRHFLMVKLPDRKQAYFRFYDPRVLRLYLPTCTAEEIRLIFGPIKYYLMEDEMPDTLLRFSNKGVGVGRKIVPLRIEDSVASDGSSPIQSPSHTG